VLLRIYSVTLLMLPTGEVLLQLFVGFVTFLTI